MAWMNGQHRHLRFVCTTCRKQVSFRSLRNLTCQHCHVNLSTWFQRFCRQR